jgi:hypothetical protein
MIYWNYQVKYSRAVANFQPILAALPLALRWGFCSEEEMNSMPVGTNCISKEKTVDITVIIITD